VSNILLTTINARYIHASLGLRYLYANMGDLKPQTTLCEYTINERAEDIAEKLIAQKPAIIGFGVYIWNSTITTEVVSLLKTINPHIKVIVGGPEISYETTEQLLYKLADHIITGQADFAFAECCQELLSDKTPAKLISPLPFNINDLASPYCDYTDDDLKHRVLYVEASRGCPFKCEFCLSSLDKTATGFNLDNFISDLDLLVKRGAKQFKFVDRTFNLKTATCQRILTFFLDAMEKQGVELFLHFELIPDRLPDALKELLPRFPPGSLQFEIGIQSFNVDVQQLISRKQDMDKTNENMRWLRANTHAHIHSDLIFGLPGETLQSFQQGFDELISLDPQEVQVGILKRLRGTPIARHTEEYEMRYMDSPPYRVLSTKDITFENMQRLVRFARFWDLIANSGRFPSCLPLILANEPFSRFLQTSDWLFCETAATHKIALPKLIDLVHRLLTEHFGLTNTIVTEAVVADFKHNKIKGMPACVKNMNQNSKVDPKNTDTNNSSAIQDSTKKNHAVAKRQRRHSINLVD